MTSLIGLEDSRVCSTDSIICVAKATDFLLNGGNAKCISW